MTWTKLPKDFRPLMEKLPIGILVHLGGTIHYVNQTLVNMLHARSDALIGLPATDLFSPESKQFLYQSTASSHTVEKPVEAEIHTLPGATLLVEISHSHLDHESNRFHILAIKDVTQRRLEEENYRRQANFDPLTSLPNRALFMDRLSQELIRARRGKSHVALMFIDLDRFKWVNDTLGHAAGDTLLKEASARILSCHRKSDTVARLGGDEFTVILPDIAKGPYAERVCRNILDQLAQPFILEGQEAFISGSIGITVFPDDADSLQDLLKNADTAMYRAKADGRNTFRFFTHEMHAQALDRVSMEKDLYRAMELNQLALHYQPILHLKSMRIIGAEAFLRWDHPQRGMVPPNVFIPLAEEIGLSSHITEWTLQTACNKAQQWRQLPGMEDFFISVNLTCFRCRDLSQGDKIQSVIQQSGLPTQRLVLEITESILSENEPAAMEMLTGLRELGISLWLDDFGTGQSSLRVLKSLPLTGVKIDRMFIQDIDHNSESAILVDIIIGLARNLNLQVVGEGVETLEQQNYLKKRDCHMAQGYLYGRPMPAHEFEHSLNTKQ